MSSEDMNPQEQYDLYIYYSGPFGLFSAIICGLAIITSYIYPSLRKFPNVVLVWTWYVQFTYFYYQYLQGVDAPPIDGNGFDASPMGLMDFRSARVDLGRQPAVHEEETVGVPSGNSTPASKPQA